jgi:hypothetical protein
VSGKIALFDVFETAPPFSLSHSLSHHIFSSGRKVQFARIDMWVLDPDNAGGASCQACCQCQGDMWQWSVRSGQCGAVWSHLLHETVGLELVNVEPTHWCCTDRSDLTNRCWFLQRHTGGRIRRPPPTETAHATHTHTHTHTHHNHHHVLGTTTISQWGALNLNHKERD